MGLIAPCDKNYNKIRSYNFLTDNTGHDDLTLDNARCILLNELKKTVKEKDKALTLKGSGRDSMYRLTMLYCRLRSSFLFELLWVGLNYQTAGPLSWKESANFLGCMKLR